MSLLDLVREDLRDFAGYSSARREASGGAILLNANESPWSSPGDHLELNRYPAPQPEALLGALAELYGTKAERLLVGRGSDEAIDLLIRACCEAGRHAILISPPTFGMYAVCARVQNARVVKVPLRIDDAFSLDVDAVLAAVDDSVRLVFVCSPNNPSGNAVPGRALRRLAEALRGRAILVVDEAYAEFSEQPSAIELLEEYPHVAVLRTLSKAYALAGARIGTLIADPSLVRVLRNLMAPYPLPTPSVHAALAALRPHALALAQSRVGLVRQERARLAAGLARLPGVRQVYDSKANFLLLRVEDADAVMRQAAACGIVLRKPDLHSVDGGFVRISVGTPEENDALLGALRHIDGRRFAGDARANPERAA